jgi:hypothetical protein
VLSVANTSSSDGHLSLSVSMQRCSVSMHNAYGSCASLSISVRRVDGLLLEESLCSAAPAVAILQCIGFDPGVFGCFDLAALCAATPYVLSTVYCLYQDTTELLLLGKGGGKPVDSEDCRHVK